MTRFIARGPYRGRPPYVIGGRPPTGRAAFGILVAAVVVAAGMMVSTEGERPDRLVEKPAGVSSSGPRDVPWPTPAPPRPDDAPTAEPPPVRDVLEQPAHQPVPEEVPEPPQTNASATESPSADLRSDEEINVQEQGRKRQWPSWDLRWGIPSLGLVLIIIFGPGWFWIMTGRRHVWTIVRDGQNARSPGVDGDLTTVLDDLAQGPRRDLIALAVVTEPGARTVGPVRACHAASLVHGRPTTCEYTSLAAAIDAIRRSYRGRHKIVEVTKGGEAAEAGILSRPCDLSGSMPRQPRGTERSSSHWSRTGAAADV
jgi:hypothetical protein